RRLGARCSGHGQHPRASHHDHAEGADLRRSQSGSGMTGPRLSADGLRKEINSPPNKEIPMSTKAHRRPLAKILPALAAASLIALSVNDGHATAQQVGQVSFNRLCPQLIGGDDEFNGNGPDVDAQFILRRAAGNEQVLLDVYLHEMETRSDWTEGEIRRSMSLGTSPAGRPFTHIWAPSATGAFQWT